MKHLTITLLLAVSFLFQAGMATTISNVQVDSVIKQADGRWTGKLTYDLTGTTSAKIFVWLEFSNNDGATWEQRDIHAIGHIGGVTAGTGRWAKWVVDGDKGPLCKIRVRVNDTAATYSNFEADSNKFPFPFPSDPYAGIERLAGKTDFPNLADVNDLRTDKNRIPRVNFRKSMSSGPIRVGFSRSAHFRTTNLFMHCMYITDGIEQYVFLSGDCVRMYNAYLHLIRDSLRSRMGIPEDNIMITWNHRHYVDGDTGDLPKIVPLVRAAKDAAVPAKVAWLDVDLGRRFNYPQTYMGTTPTFATKLGHFCENSLVYPWLTFHWQTDSTGDTSGVLLEDTRAGYLQHKLDAPLDSYLQGMIFKNMNDSLTGILMKFTGHTDTDHQTKLYSTLKARFGANVEVMYVQGYGGNQALLHNEGCGTAQMAAPGWNRFGGTAQANYFADLLARRLPAMEFTPVTKAGAVMGWDLFGSAYHTRDSLMNYDTERQGIGVGVIRINDIYMSTLPSEPCAELGLYLRARTSGLKHFYTGYGNTWGGNYWGWGRWAKISCYTCGELFPLYEGFRLGNEVVRGVNILHDSW